MKFSFRVLLPLTFLACSQLNLSGQVTANFTAPDTVCVGEHVNIVNVSTGGTTYNWNLCSANANDNPFTVDIGNPQATIHQPSYSLCVKQGNDCFSFVSNQLPVP
jgi:hypothetical protein